MSVKRTKIQNFIKIDKTFDELSNSEKDKLLKILFEKFDLIQKDLRKVDQNK